MGSVTDLGKIRYESQGDFGTLRQPSIPTSQSCNLYSLFLLCQCPSLIPKFHSLHLCVLYPIPTAELAYSLLVKSEALQYEHLQTHVSYSSRPTYIHAQLNLLHPVQNEGSVSYCLKMIIPALQPILDLAIFPGSIFCLQPSPFYSSQHKSVLKCYPFLIGEICIANLSDKPPIFLYPLFLLPQLSFTLQLTESGFLCSPLHTEISTAIQLPNLLDALDLI